MTITKRQFEAAEMLSEALNGEGLARERAVRRLQEAISTSDIPVQLGPAMTSILMASYNEVFTSWSEYARRIVVDDFESSELYTFEFRDPEIAGVNDGDPFYSGGLAGLGELDEYPVISLEASGVKVKTRKAGVQIALSWEAIRRNGKINLVREALTDFGKRVKKNENFQAASQLVDSDGVRAHWTNRATGNPELSLGALENSFLDLAVLTDAKGRRITSPSQYNLVVPPALKPIADGIVGIGRLTRTDAEGNTYEMNNPVAGKIRKVIEVPEIGAIAGANADKAWFLLPDANELPLPHVANVFLSGEESPRVFVKKDTNSSPEDGSYDNDSYATKVRHFVSGAFGSADATIVSDGSGS